MLEIEIDGRKTEVADGSTVDAALPARHLRAALLLQELSIAANCRMCLVQVEKAPKPLPAPPPSPTA
ncbi:MAG: 2Fe-2S iron-sulfur cluster-binding protein [Rhodocyclaceae bacterium]